MRDAPAYNGDRFSMDFAASALCSAITGMCLGPLAWWLARGYLRHNHPAYPELAGAAVPIGVLDGILLAIGGFVLCFVVRIWHYERRERKRSDADLRKVLNELESGKSGTQE